MPATDPFELSERCAAMEREIGAAFERMRIVDLLYKHRDEHKINSPEWQKWTSLCNEIYAEQEAKWRAEREVMNELPPVVAEAATFLPADSPAFRPTPIAKDCGF